MGFVETILAGVITTVISFFVLESIREHRKEGKQWMEKVFDVFLDIVREIWSLIRDRI